VLGLKDAASGPGGADPDVDEFSDDGAATVQDPMSNCGRLHEHCG
jgi:hypothetical protein